MKKNILTEIRDTYAGVIKRTWQLHNLDTIGFYMALTGFIILFGTIFLETLQLFLPGNFFFAEGINEYYIHGLLILSTMSFFTGVVVCHSVDKAFSKL